MKSLQKRISHLVGPLIALVFLYLLLTIFVGKFLTIDNQMNILRQASLNSIMALGMLFALLTAQIDLSMGAILGFSSSVMSVLYRKADIENAWFLLFVCLSVGFICGLINGILFTKLRLPTTFVSTLGMAQVLRGAAILITDAAPTNNFPDVISFIGHENIGSFPVCFIVVILAIIIASIFLNKTVAGRNIYIVGGNIEAARLAGINTDRSIVTAFTLSGFLSALTAIVLIGRVNASYPTSGEGYEMNAVAACVIGGASFLGGKGSAVGTLIGALFIAIINNGLNLLGARACVQQIVVGIMLIAAVCIDILRVSLSKKQMLINQEKAFIQETKSASAVEI